MRFHGQNPSDLSEYVDFDLYIGDRRLIKRLSSTKNKSLGECLILFYSLKYCNSGYDLIFKISGRYYLTEAFDMSNYDKENFNFKYLSGG